jgi:hypothetical protein
VEVLDLLRAADAVTPYMTVAVVTNVSWIVTFSAAVKCG